MSSGEAITSEDIEEAGIFPVYGGNGLRGYADRYTHEGTHALVGRQGALCGNVNIARGPFYASEHAVVVQPENSRDTGWVARLLEAMDLGQYSTSAAQPGLSVDTLLRLLAPVPPMRERRELADYLDRETARIDELIAEQEVLIASLAERRQALVSFAVTGLESSPTNLKRLASVQTGLTLGKETDEGVATPYLRVANVQAGSLDLAHVKTVRVSPNELSRHRLRPGDVLMTEGGDLDKLGRGAVWNGEIDPCLHQNHVFAVRCGAELARRFLTYWMDARPARQYFRDNAKKTTNLAAINSTILGMLPIALPTLDEQRRVVAHLDEQTAKIDDLTAECRELIALLKERRSVLITAAVTGKVDVRDNR